MEAVRKNARALAEYADSMGSISPPRPAPRRRPSSKAFLDSLGAKGLRVNYDPANLVMVAGDDLVAGVYTLKRLHRTYARQGRRQDRDRLRGPAGTGGVDWDKYIAALQRHRLYRLSDGGARGRRRPGGRYCDGGRFPA